MFLNTKLKKRWEKWLFGFCRSVGFCVLGQKPMCHCAVAKN